MVPIEVAGQRLVLMPQRALWWPAGGLLLVADVHLGKAASFRRLGVPVPEATTRGTLDRLDDAIGASGASQVVFLGDLLHSAHAHERATVDEVDRWRAGNPGLNLTLVRGNHDRRAGDPPAQWGIECVDEPLRRGPLALRHHPEPDAQAYVIAGHVHPAAMVGSGFERLRLPSFHFGPAVGLLPAFGEFAGSKVLGVGAGDRVFGVAGTRVVELTAALA